MVKDTAPGIQARQMKSFEMDIIKIALFTIMLSMLIFPVMSGDGYYEATPNNQPISEQVPSQDANHIAIPLTDSPRRIANGNVSSYSGFAYADDSADVFRFVDIKNDVTLNQSIETGNLEKATLTRADIDNDGSTEFLIVNHNGSAFNLLVVDFNDAVTTKFNLSITDPTGVLTGYFDSDTDLDVAVFSQYGSLMLDLQTGQLIGNFTFSGFTVNDYAVGRFLESSQDSIAFALYTGTKQGNLSIVAGNGTVMKTEVMHNAISSLARFDYGSGLDDIALSISDGNLTAINPGIMSQIFSSTGHPYPSVITTGNLNSDGQEDLVVASSNSNYTVYIDGTNGSVILHTDEIGGAYMGHTPDDAPSRRFHRGSLDTDGFTDYACVTADTESLAFLRGSDGTFGYIVPTYIGFPAQITTTDHNGDSQDDIMVLVSSTVHIIISDYKAPVISPEPLSPPHPTILDPYVEIEVGVHDETPIILAEIYIHQEDGNWTQPVDELQNSGTQYYAFLVGLAEGSYDYYLRFQDSYLNIAMLGNETHPLNFTVAGHLTWTASKYVDTSLDHDLLAIGNASDGSEVIYTLDIANDIAYLDKYTPRGENETLAVVANKTFSDYWLYAGMMDGDDILDPIVVLLNGSSNSLNVSIFHGSTGTHWFSSEYPYANLTHVYAPKAYDANNDGIDEFYLVSEHYFNFSYTEPHLLRLDSSGTWTNTRLSGGHSETFGLGFAKTINSNSVEACVTSGQGSVDIVNATSMTIISQHNVTKSGYDYTLPVSAYAFKNASESKTKFLLYVYLAGSVDYWMGYHIFDASVSDINQTHLFLVQNLLFTEPELIDADSDGTDEIIGVDYSTSDAALIDLDGTAHTVWRTPISNSEFLSSVLVDFDGDTESEFGVFTRQDEQLTILSLAGEIERTLSVGAGFGSARLSTVDLGYGEEIVAYPLLQSGITKIGVIRDIVLIRRLNASLTYTPHEVLQGESLSIFVDVTNIYSEVINDAEVYVTVHYQSGSDIINQTKALIFGTTNYSTNTAVNWPMGVVNLSVQVSHPLYDSLDEYHPEAVVVMSPLDVVVYTREIVMQNSTFTTNVTVTDSLGVRVSDATVQLTIDGTEYFAAYQNTQYRLEIANIDIIPGEYSVNATADHLYASEPASSNVIFRVETDEILIDRDMPSVIEQDEPFEGWLNITDVFNNPVENALVMVVGGNLEIGLVEHAPGCYYLNSTASISTGNHSFDIYVEHEFLQGTNFGDFNIAIMGNLNVEVPEIPPAAGGELFNLTIFLNDNYGTSPSNAWVIVEIDGRNVTATRTTGGRFRVELNATFASGRWNLTVYYGSEFSHPSKKTSFLSVLSDATVSIESSDGWRIGQSNSTTIEVRVEDWRSTPIENATVGFLVRGTTYTLEYVGNGVYYTDISTVGWPYGPHDYFLIVDHEYLYPYQMSGEITVIADPTINIIPSTMEPVQYSILSVEIEVADLYGNPLTGLEVQATFASMQATAEETEVRGTYVATFDVGDTYHGDYNISVSIEGEMSVVESNHMPIYVEVFTPRLEALGTEQVTMAAGISLLLSLIGMAIFVKVSSAISTTPRREEEIKNSITRLDRVYTLLIAVSGLIFIHSWTLYMEGQYIYALIESIILLGASVLLYGLWLYRDAYSSILLEGSLSAKRVAFGIWHLFLVPFIVFQIFTYGSQLEHFQRYILEVPQFVIGEISIPPMLATILGTYMSSIVVVVVSFYREIRKGLARIDDMEAAGTPQDVVEEEQALLIGRTGSSIRIKFLMFLVILGATTIMQLDFLRNYSMAAIVLIPVLFLVLIPFISSRIVRGVPKLANRVRRSEREESRGSMIE